MKIFLSVFLILLLSDFAFPQTDRAWKTIYTFSGRSTENTDDFTIKAKKWRVVWEANKQYEEVYGGNLIVYLVDSNEEEECVINAIPSDEGKTIIRKKGSFYFKVSSVLVDWKIEVQIPSP